MCILCVIQKWSRKIATMLPWLVIPLIGLWALSQLLPPAFRFEITSSRLACVLVLLVTLFWYEVLMPQLSAWQIRRDARLRERKRSEAIELQKLRKTATRRCRNCYTAYRDQNPGGGKFMCSYCGHVSKRPVLDLPVLPGMNNAGILKDLVNKGGKILNGKAWSDNGWMCGQDLLENGSWSGGPFTGKSSSYWQKNGGDFFGGDDEHCLTERSCSRILEFACKALARIFFWRKLFRVSSSGDDASANAERRGMLDNSGENGVNGQESRGEKARRKAEEKRLARLEKELLEEEERKQREEVARLVEERRRLRDEEMGAVKEHGKGVSCVKARDGKKESERKRREKKKEKDRGSSKSNSDAEEVEKRTTKESERNKSESDRQEQPRTASESLKSHGAEVGSGLKVAAASNHSRGSAGTRYFDRMRGTFLSSSRAFTGGGFFGKSVNATTISRDHKPNAFVETTPSTIGKDSRSTTNGDNKSACHPVLVGAQPSVAPKKSWQQLFTRSSSISPPPLSSNVISRPTVPSKTVQGPSVSDHPTSTRSLDNPINFGLSSPFSLPSFSFGSSGNGTALSLSSEPMLSKAKDLPHQFFPEDSEIFEDPCYDPDPISLLGPVSESLDEFQRDLGYVAKAKPSEITKPSPIESPFSRLRVSEERHVSSFPFPGSTSGQDNPNNISDAGTWQMWNTTPLVQDGLGLISGPSSWLLHPEKNSNKEDIINPVPQRTMASLFKNDEQVSSGTQSPHNVPLGSFQNGGHTFNGPAHTIMGDPWLPEAFFGPTLIHENQVLLKSKEEGVQNGQIYGNPSDSAANSWDKNDWAMQSAGGASRPPAGSFYSRTDVQSLWSRN